MQSEKPHITVFETIATVLFIIILLLVFLQVLFRYVLKISVPWTEEGSRFLLIWMVFLGSVATLAANRDIKLTVLSSKLSRQAGWILYIFAHLVITVFGVIFLSGSITMARLNWEIPSLTLPGISLGSIYLSSVFAGTAVIIIAIIRVISGLRAFMRGNRQP